MLLLPWVTCQQLVCGWFVAVFLISFGPFWSLGPGLFFCGLLFISVLNVLFHPEAQECPFSCSVGSVSDSVPIVVVVVRSVLGGPSAFCAPDWLKASVLDVVSLTSCVYCCRLCRMRCFRSFHHFEGVRWRYDTSLILCVVLVVVWAPSSAYTNNVFPSAALSAGFMSILPVLPSAWRISSEHQHFELSGSKALLPNFLHCFLNIVSVWKYLRCLLQRLWAFACDQRRHLLKSVFISESLRVSIFSRIWLFRAASSLPACKHSLVLWVSSHWNIVYYYPDQPPSYTTAYLWSLSFLCTLTRAASSRKIHHKRGAALRTAAFVTRTLNPTSSVHFCFIINSECNSLNLWLSCIWGFHWTAAGEAAWEMLCWLTKAFEDYTSMRTLIPVTGCVLAWCLTTFAGIFSRVLTIFHPFFESSTEGSHHLSLLVFPAAELLDLSSAKVIKLCPEASVRYPCRPWIVVIFLLCPWKFDWFPHQWSH